MTTTDTVAATSGVTTVPQRSPAVAVRRWFIVVSPVLAGLFAVLGAAADPGAGVAGEQMWQLYADNPDRLQWKSFGLHWSYSFWIAPALLLAGYVRGRGAWLATAAAAAGFVGLSTLPGLLFVDFYDSAIGQVAGVETTAAVAETMGEGMWAVQAMALPGLVGAGLGLPLASLALWRAGRVRWWAPVAVLVGYAGFMGSNVMWWGCVITTVAFTVFAVAVERGTRDV